MLWGGNLGTLEIRAEGGATHLSAVFAAACLAAADDGGMAGADRGW